MVKVRKYEIWGETPARLLLTVGTPSDTFLTIQITDEITGVELNLGKAEAQEVLDVLLLIMQDHLQEIRLPKEVLNGHLPR